MIAQMHIGRFHQRSYQPERHADMTFGANSVTNQGDAVAGVTDQAEKVCKDRFRDGIAQSVNDGAPIRGGRWE